MLAGERIASALDRLIGVCPPDLTGRYRAKENSCQQRNKKGEDRHAHIDIDRHLHWKSRGRLPSVERAQQRCGDGTSRDTPENREHQRLYQQLPEDAYPTSADGDADGQLTAAVRRSGGEQTAQVGAGRQQDQPRQQHDRKQKRPHRASKRIAQQTGTCETKTAFAIGCRILLLQLFRNRSQIDIRLLTRDPRLEAANRPQSMVASAGKPVVPLDLLFIHDRDPDLCSE